MRSVLLIAFLAFGAIVKACTGYTKPFCYLYTERPNDVMVTGVVRSLGTQSLELQVIQVWRGSETRSVVALWDDKDIECNGTWSMKVADMAQIGDTIIALLPKITVVTNAWDVVGDYNRPNWFYAEPVLGIKNGRVKGFINGSYPYSPPYWFFSDMPYGDFTNFWSQHPGDCSNLVAIAEWQSPGSTEIIREQAILHIVLKQSSLHRVRLISLQGDLMSSYSITQSSNIDLSVYAKGLYFVAVVEPDGNSTVKKIFWAGPPN
jgi:hypothetical protein